jgi:hypothetical protein
VLARADVDQRRHVRRVELERAGGAANDARERQRDMALDRFALEQEAQVLARDLDRLLGQAGVLVASRDDFGDVSGMPVDRVGGDVVAAEP